MANPSEIERRLAAVEARVEEVAADASAVRHLAAANDRDLADLGVKVDANRKAINALGIQTAARFDRLEGRADRLEEKVDDGFTGMRAGFAQVDRNFLAIRGVLDATAAAQQRTAELLAVLIEERGDR
jgi:hypothetical protein